MCRSRRELSNAYLLAKIGVDTAENEPLDVWGKLFNSIFTSLLNKHGFSFPEGLDATAKTATLQGSFSAVSKPNFASKYAFESYLHNALLCTALNHIFSFKRPDSRRSGGQARLHLARGA